MEGSTPQALRPLNFGEVLDVGINLALKNLKPLLLAVAVVVVPVQLLAAVVQLSTFPESFGSTTGQPTFSTESGETPEIDSGELAVFIGGTAIGGLFGFIAALLATAACFKVVSDAYLGEAPDWRGSLRFALRRLGSLLWVGLLVLVALGGTFAVSLFVTGFLAAIVPVPVAVVLLIALLVAIIYVSVTWTVAVPGLLIEDVRGTGALRRSFALVRGRWWSTFGLLVVATIIATIIQLVVATAFTLLALAAPDNVVVSFVAQGLGNGLAAVLSTPVIAAVVTIIYFDLRVRKEGFDLRLLAERIGRDPRQRSGTESEQPGGADSERAEAAGPGPSPDHEGWAPPAGAAGSRSERSSPPAE